MKQKDKFYLSILLFIIAIVALILVFIPDPIDLITGGIPIIEAIIGLASLATAFWSAR